MKHVEFEKTEYDNENETKNGLIKKGKKECIGNMASRMRNKR